MAGIYKVFVVVVLLLYGAAGWYGWEITTATRRQVPEGMRGSPGGYRSYHLWYGGIRGGK